jgi:hypothetical protein
MVRGIFTEEKATEEVDEHFFRARFVHVVSCLFRTLKRTWRLLAVIKKCILKISEELMAKWNMAGPAFPDEHVWVLET